MKPVRTDLIMSTFKIPVWPSRALSTLLVALALLWTATSARAQTSGAPPERIAYQGFLTDGSGTALGATTPKNYDVTLKIYTAPTGGACVWAETQTVTVDRGNFSLLLGEGNGGVVVGGVTVPHALASIFATNNASDRYVETVVAGVGAGLATVTIAPRIRLVPTAYSFLSTYANALANANGSNILSSVNGSLTANGSLTVSGNGIFNSYVGIGQSSPGFPLNFPTVLGDKISLWGAGGPHYGFGIQGSLLQIHTATYGDDVAFGYGTSANMTETMRVKGNGNVGIGYTSPGYKLDVNGDIGVRGIHLPNGGTMYARNADGSESQILQRWANDWDYMTMARNGLVIRNNSGGGAMWIQNNGNVGIGNANPSSTLDVNGNGRFGSAQIGVVQTGFYYDGNIALRAAGGTFFQNAGGANTFMYINPSGFVGIGTTGPQCPLDVEGGYAFGAHDYRYFNRSVNGGTTGSGGYNYPYSIWASGGIACSELNCISDLRVKEVIKRSNSSEDLALVQRLQITDYRKIDVVSEGTNTFKGVIAQEVEKIMPSAVSQSTNFIPNVYALSLTAIQDAARGTLRVTLPKAHDLQTNDLVKLIVENGGKKFDSYRVVGVEATNVFEVALASSNRIDRVFVYGKQVPDFRTVNYDRLFTTGLGAIQELASRSEAQAEEIRVLKLRVARMAELERKSAKLQQMEGELADLKRIVTRLTEQGGRPKSTQAALRTNEN